MATHSVVWKPDGKTYQVESDEIFTSILFVLEAGHFLWFHLIEYMQGKPVRGLVRDDSGLD